MQLSEMRYITGLIVQGGGKIAGYALAEPTGEVKKPDLVLAKDLKQYLATNRCKIINADVDMMGQVVFRSKADQESYVTMNASGYVLGWPKKPLPKLHEGNKTGGKTGEMLRPTHSYLIVDINESENVVKVMNIGGMVKPMTLGKLKSAVGEGLIVSNVEVKDGNIRLLSQGMDELVMGKTVSAPVSSIPPVTMSKPAPTPTVQPTKPASAPLKPPTFGTGANKPITPPVVPPIASKPVIPPVVPPTVHAKSAMPPIPTVQPKVEQPKQTASIPPVVKPQAPKALTFKQMVQDNYDFENNFAKEFAGQNVRVRLDMDDLAAEQFNVVTVNGQNYLTYVTDGSGTHELPYFIRHYGPDLEHFLNLFNIAEQRQSLSGVKIDLYFFNKLISGFDYRMLYTEAGFLNFGYLIDWNKVDLFSLSDEQALYATFLNPMTTLLMLPNKELDVKNKTITDLVKLYGRFEAYHEDVWSDLLYVANLGKHKRTENLKIQVHPHARISEMSDDALYMFFDYPFGHDEDARELILDLTATSLRFIAKNSIKVQHGANYDIYLPASCKRVHDGAVATRSGSGVNKRFRLDRPDDEYQRQYHNNGKSCESIAAANTITFHGANLERIDKVGAPYAPQGMNSNREFVCAGDWTAITNLTDTAIAIETLPKSNKAIDVAPYIDTHQDSIIVDDWYGIGTWSDIGKGKLSLRLGAKPKQFHYNDRVNILIDGSATKVKIELMNEKESMGYTWPVIDYLFVEEGVTELEIIAYTCCYQHKKSKLPGYTDNYIKQLILPASLRSLSLKITHRNHKRFIRNINVADNSIMARLDLKEQFRRFCVEPDNLYKYAAARAQHDKNMLSDLIGSDLSHVAVVEFNADFVKSNLAKCGIIL